MVLEADFSPAAVVALLALLERACIVVPVVRSSRVDRERIHRITGPSHLIRISESDQVEHQSLQSGVTHSLFETLRAGGHPGLVLFTSETSGDPKAAVHDVFQLVKKYRTRRPAWRIVAFLLFDHIGGINTIFHTLANGGTLITVDDRSPDGVCAAIERHRAEVLPASPTFLRLLLLSAAQDRFDLSSLRVINYGTEPMTQATLTRLEQAFPNVRLQQSYGMAEVGILRSRSRDNGSLWVKLGGEGVQTRVVDGTLQVKSGSAMLEIGRAHV